MARTTRTLSVVSDDGEAEGLDQSYDERAYDLTVGGILRDARERAGYSLREVATLLRIRHAYLQAMEEGRFKDLPGSVYAVGFLKTYGELLDLDVDELVRRFKSEIDGAPQHAELNFPAPVPEGRMPGGALVLIALLLGGLVYGGWYYLASNDRTVAEIVAPLPERFAALIGGASDPVVAPPPEAVTPVTPVPPATETPAAPPAPVAETPLPALEDAPADTPVPTLTADNDAPALPAAPSVADTPPAVPAGTVEDAPATALNQPLDQPATPVPSTADLPPAPEAPAAAPAAETPAAAATSTVASAPPPLPPAEEPVAAPAPALDDGIVITATAQSWVQIRDAEGNLVMTRVLEPGEVYSVPQTDGLRMVTGNAGGLRIMVDGEEAPALGGPGDVVRDVALDGAQLLAGAAAD
ncbi:RodZ domain-containing protein [Inquilinus sp. CAU 1745]|uniref:helix-turn-helix domain-containing protein n=1 Tax=Inquilinus sp. CAU 1745 TaxID=3140369 RepID=UPI00325A8AA1